MKVQVFVYMGFYDLSVWNSGVRVIVLMIIISMRLMCVFVGVY